MEEKRSIFFLNGFSLKIIGIISMIFDHFAVIAYMKGATSKWNWFTIDVYNDFRIVGRIAFVIFSFLIVEGMIHTRKKEYYLLRLFILAGITDLGYFIIAREYIGNPVTTLFLGALGIYFLSHPNKYLKFGVIIPTTLAILMGLSLIPLKADNDLNGYLTILLFYGAYLLSQFLSKYVITKYGLVEDAFMNSNYYIGLRNGLSVVLYLTYMMIIYMWNPIFNSRGVFSQMMNIQVYSLVALIPLCFYNGKRGPDNIYLKYGFYLFFPLHIVIIFLIINAII